MPIASLKCPNCGAGLQIGPDIDVFACAFCGNAAKVVRQGGLIALQDVAENIVAVASNTDRTASELALIRLDKELNAVTQNICSLEEEQASISKGFVPQFKEVWFWTKVLATVFLVSAVIYQIIGIFPTSVAAILFIVCAVAVRSIQIDDIVKINKSVRQDLESVDDALVFMRKSLVDINAEIERHKRIVSSASISELEGIAPVR